MGSHLVDRLMLMGHYVIALDNFFTGKRANVAHWIGHQNFELIRHDVVEPIHIEVDRIYHLASPASPPRYQVSVTRQRRGEREREKDDTQKKKKKRNAD